MHHKKIIFYIFLAPCMSSVFLFIVPSGSRIGPGLKNSQKQLKNCTKSNHINGVVLASGKDGKSTVIKDNETSNKNDIVNVGQLFPTASLQKIMIGTAIYNLQQKKELGWNMTLSRYYPQVSGSNDIAIRELMNHTSGLINNVRPSEPLKNQEEQIAYMLKYTQSDHLHTWDYQDVDYELLAVITGKESHLSYNDYIQKNFAKSLRLRQAKDYFEVRQNEASQPMSNNVDRHKAVVTISSDFEAGDLFISSNDYWKFVYNKVLKDLKMTNEHAQQTRRQVVAYCGGVYFKGDVIRAEGSIPRYNSCFVANYRTKEMIISFSNSINYLTLKRVSDYLLRHYMGAGLF